ncbi:MAG TPA: DNA polymerase III subunit delta [Thermoanaerobacterales bacterium]|nr:DNA polymerase III subunit delta [Thermoanaerobacterales bacterium]
MENLQLFFGEEKLLIKEEIEKIKTEMIPAHLEAVNFIVFDGKTASEDEIINAITTVPMLQDKKLVVVYDARFFESARSEKEGQEDDRKDDFARALQEVPSYTRLIFTCEKVDKRKKIFKLIQKEGVVREFSAPSLKDKAIWVQKRAEFYGKKMDLTAAYFMAQYTRDLFQTDAELKKVTAFVGEKQTIKQNEIQPIFSKSLENNIFDLMDYIGLKKPNLAIGILNDLLLQGEKGIVILFMISKHIMDLISVKSLQDLDFQELKQRLNLHPFVLKKAMEQAKNFSLEELRQALRLCQQLDLDIKRGKIDDRKGIELLITKIAKK